MTIAKIPSLLAIAVTAAMALPGAVRAQSPIQDKWRQLGGSAGVLGHPTSCEFPLLEGRGNMQFFEHGTIAFSPRTGHRSVQVAYRAGNDVIFEWDPTDPFHYDLFIVRWRVNRSHGGQVDKSGSRTSGRFVIPNADPSRSYGFIVEGADRKGPFGTVSAIQGWTNEVTVPPVGR